MAVLVPHRHHRRRRPLAVLLLLLAFFFLASASSSFLGGREKTEGSVPAPEVVIRRRLGGPGSSPPTCRSKCGSCSPCTAVHVPIQPGLSLPLEYYPEAWRCKCGNSLFMP
ncbi:EPIDERMAL PATTERNING FACTOR-like protein 4 [Momordica charantia]|uniref:Epidermal patterning factor-like protein n=1 Tax=Momordica charantia TaxID=3673 RepID=A0A6J1CBX1_MOMCH|nr:EPIDERMAL PATTERNING FACTOR-like protein 4 [Momordica charantia]